MYSIFRVLKFALQGFFRNFWLSVVTVTMMLMALLSVTLLVGIDYLKQATITGVEQKIDILISIRPGVSAENVDAFVRDLDAMAEVKKTRVITPEENKKLFEESNISTGAKKALEIFEANENPFTYSIAISAYDLNQYSTITNFVDQDKYKDIVEDKSFNNYQAFIDKINSLSDNINKYSWYLIAIFALISIIVIFNTIRISIYSRKEEIAVMKLVGATDWFVRMPFMVESTLYALVAVLIIIVLVYPTANFIQPYLNNYFQSAGVIDIAGYFNQNFWLIFGGQFIALALINILSTALAVRKYLRV